MRNVLAVVREYLDMKPCAHRREIGVEDRVGCDNHADLIHVGTVPRSFCYRCPYAAAPAVGFFAQTTQLLVQKARRGEITVAAKPCGGCNEVKRRETDVLQFVFPYWHRGASDDENRSNGTTLAKAKSRSSAISRRGIEATTFRRPEFTSTRRTGRSGTCSRRSGQWQHILKSIRTSSG